NSLLLLPIRPKLTNGPLFSAPCLPHPSVLTQIPELVPLHPLQNSLTQTNPILHPDVETQRSTLGFSGSVVPLHLNLFVSKQTPRPSDSMAQAQLEVPLFMVTGQKVESHAVEVQTPFAQVLPLAQALLHAPQWSLEVRRSWQPPLQRATPLPLQIGVGRA
ncbi:hypothetical protein FB567DRAFT_433077, partial [Paraphoma chrysanthemicola]